MTEKKHADAVKKAPAKKAAEKDVALATKKTAPSAKLTSAAAKPAAGTKPATAPKPAAGTKPAAPKPAIAAKSAAPKPAAPKPATAPKPAAPKPAAGTKPAAPKPATARGKAATGKKVASAEAARQIVFDTSEERSAIADQAIADPVILAALVENLSGPQRRIRQFSAATVNEIAAQEPKELLAHIDEIADALHRPEAQTRWECLEALSNLVEHDPPSCEQALHGAEISLYDEGSGMARLAALRFLCAYGAQDSRRARKVWPLIEEAIQCYHGDSEFPDMQIAVAQFAAGKVGKSVKQSLAARMSFDAKHSKGALGRRAREIVELCEK
jgi:hypothetical protein